MFSPLQACKYDVVLHVHYLKLQIHRPCTGEFLVYPCLLPPVKKKKKYILIYTQIHRGREKPPHMQTRSICAIWQLGFAWRGTVKFSRETTAHVPASSCALQHQLRIIRGLT